MSQKITVSYKGKLISKDFNDKFNAILGDNLVVSGFRVIPGAGKTLSITLGSDSVSRLFIGGALINETSNLPDLLTVPTTPGADKVYLVCAKYDSSIEGSVCTYVLLDAYGELPPSGIICVIAMVIAVDGFTSSTDLQITHIGKLLSAVKLVEVFNRGDGSNSIVMNSGDNISQGSFSTASGTMTKALSFAAHAEGTETEVHTECGHAEGHLAQVIAGSTANIVSYSNTVPKTITMDRSLVFSVNEYVYIFSPESPLIKAKITAISGDNLTLTIDTTTTLDAYCKLAVRIGSASKHNAAHAEGYATLASGNETHAEGFAFVASGDTAHAEGDNTVAAGNGSHAQNKGTIAKGYAQTVIGEYNVPQGTATYRVPSDFAYIIGNGSSNSNRSNALTIDWSGGIVAGQLVGNASFSQYNFTDFLHSNVLQGTFLQGYPILSGTCASTVPGDVNHPGNVLLSSTTSAGSGYCWRTDNTISLGGGEVFEACFKTQSSSSNATLRLGLHNSTSASAPTNGVWLEITGTTASCKTMSNSVGTTGGTTSNSVAYNSWFKVQIVVKSTTSATITLFDDYGSTLLTQTITTNIPTAANTVAVSLVATSSGTTALSVLDIDCVGYGCTRKLMR